MRAAGLVSVVLLGVVASFPRDHEEFQLDAGMTQGPEGADGAADVKLFDSDDASDEFKALPVAPPQTIWEAIPERSLADFTTASEVDLTRKLNEYYTKTNSRYANMLPDELALDDDPEAGLLLVHVDIPRLTPPLGVATFPFDGPFAQGAAMSVSIEQTNYSFLAGMEPREAVRHAQLSTSPGSWGDAVGAPLLCSEHPDVNSGVQTPGGDVGEFIIGLSAYEDLLNGKIDPDGEINDQRNDMAATITPATAFNLLVEYLATNTYKTGFHMCVGADFLNGICRSTRFCPLDTPSLLNPPPEMAPELLNHVGQEDTLPSLHTFAMFRYSVDYEVSNHIVSAAVKAVFALVWDMPIDSSVDVNDIKMARKKMVVDASPLTASRPQRAVYRYNLSPRCPTSIVPLVSTTVIQGQAGHGFVVMKEAANANRVAFAQFLIRRKHVVDVIQSNNDNGAFDQITLPPQADIKAPVFLELASTTASTTTALLGLGSISIGNDALNGEEPADVTAHRETDDVTMKPNGGNDAIVDRPPPLAFGDRDINDLSLSTRMRILAQKQLNETMTRYFGHLPIYNVMFAPVDARDTCSFYPPFRQPWSDHGPYSRSPGRDQTLGGQKTVMMGTHYIPSYTVNVVTRDEKDGRPVKIAKDVFEGQMQVLESFLRRAWPITDVETPRPAGHVAMFEWQWSHLATVGPVDGRVFDSSAHVLGGDFGQFIFALGNVETFVSRHFEQREVDQMLAAILEKSGRESMSLWSDIAGLDHWCDQTSACPALDPSFLSASDISVEERVAHTLHALSAPPARLLPLLRDTVGTHHHGDRFLRDLSLGHGEPFGVRRDLVHMAVKAFFGIMWDFRDEPLGPVRHARLSTKLDFVIMKGHKGGETSKVSVERAGMCSDTVVAAIASTDDQARLIVHHPDFERQLCDHYLQILVTEITPLQASLAALRLITHKHARDMSSKHFHRIAPEVPYFKIEFESPQCTATTLENLPRMGVTSHH